MAIFSSADRREGPAARDISSPIEKEQAPDPLILTQMEFRKYRTAVCGVKTVLPGQNLVAKSGGVALVADVC